MSKLAPYQKTIAALITGVLGWFAYVVAASPDTFTVSNAQWLALGVAVATALGVYGVPNTPASTPAPPAPGDVHGPVQ